ncbi:hypothetical protein BZM27_54335, partial [Paraburkholderia steynii]
CGPGGFIGGLRRTQRVTGRKAPCTSSTSRHREQPKRESTGIENAEGYDVTIASTGQVVHVGPDQDFSEALNEAGVEVPTSCCAGLCATCKVRYLEGEVEHNDFIVDDDERKNFSRSASPGR